MYTDKTPLSSQKENFFKKGLDTLIPGKGEAGKEIRTTEGALDFLDRSMELIEKGLKEELDKKLRETKAGLLELLERLRKAEEDPRDNRVSYISPLDVAETARLLLSLYTRRWEGSLYSDFSLMSISMETLELPSSKNGVFYMVGVEEHPAFPELLCLALKTLGVFEGLSRLYSPSYLKADLDITNPRKSPLEFIVEELVEDYGGILEDYLRELEE